MRSDGVKCGNLTNHELSCLGDEVRERFGVGVLEIIGLDIDRSS